MLSFGESWSAASLIVETLAAVRMERREIAVRGIVQGVGFRPFVYSLAQRLALQGFVRNTAHGVLIQVEGHAVALDAFQSELLTEPPPLASIARAGITPIPLRGEQGFRIDTSDDVGPQGDGNVRISPDVATCEACLHDLYDSGNRRHLYPFITCATCVPRRTIVTGAPYERERTTMARFSMCETCRREYEDPSDRRFHAETIACARCGPSLSLRDSDFRPIAGDPIARLASFLAGGGIAAIKVVGGYHLACDATNADAVAQLRLRKHRDEKPFAVMFESLEAITRVCDPSEVERRVLVSAARPIVLVRRAPQSFSPDRPVEGVAPGSWVLGAMLPSNPVQHLLLRAVRRPLVMTSGNRSQEPVAVEDVDAFERLAGIADAFMTNDRPIHVRCDDGVSRVARAAELPIRRSRGDAPRPVRLPNACGAAVLAVGGHLKNTFALGRHHDAFVSHHVGDLDDFGAYSAFEREIGLYEQLFDISPEILAHDLHPDYHSTRYATARALTQNLRTVGVQYHHAHVASCIAENELNGPVIGVAFDGSGYGGDGTIWGGEFLVGDARAVERLAHLRTITMPGGEQAVREPWRMAMSHLLDAGDDAGMVTSRHPTAAPVIERMIAQGLNAPLTSSAGRLFDAVAALAGLRDQVSFEGQAAMELESLAATAASDGSYPMEIAAADRMLILDTRPLIRAVAQDVRSGCSASLIARRFHEGLAGGIAAVCGRIRELTGVTSVVLTCGVFLNALLTEKCIDRLTPSGFRVYRHRVVPPNDGGLSLGQLAVAAAQLQGGADASTENRNDSVPRVTRTCV
ncbi:carbamoyltransferase HypF [soil metagenome]